MASKSPLVVMRYGVSTEEYNSPASGGSDVTGAGAGEEWEYYENIGSSVSLRSRETGEYANCYEGSYMGISTEPWSSNVFEYGCSSYSGNSVNYMRAPTAEEKRQADKDAFNASVANRGGFTDHPMGAAFMAVTVGGAVGGALYSLGAAVIGEIIAIVKPLMKGSNPNKIINNQEAFHVTPDGVVLPKGYNIPNNYVQNPYRNSSYGIMEGGKFVEKLRIDPATPSGFKGPNNNHFHLNGSKKHLYDLNKWPK